MQKMVENLVEGLGKYLEETGFTRFVLGLSGGVDSALTAALCAQVQGAGKVYAYMLPYRTSSKDSRIDAEAVASSLKINLDLVDISPMADAYNALTPGISPLRLGNVLARLRMIVLFDKSAELSALVAGTGNRSEILLGYSTLYGDSACAVNPIGSLYKTEVWEMARYLGLPRQVIEKAPSADLWQGQTDEKELGYSYKEIDELLILLYDKGLRPQEALNMGYDPGFVEMVTSRAARNKFKQELPRIINKRGI